MVDGASRVRLALLDDASRIARVHTDAWRETYAGMVPDAYFSEAAYERRIRMWTHFLTEEPPAGPVAVAEIEGRIVGFASSGSARGPDAEKGHAPARDIQLFTIYLLAAEHGTGIGRELLEAVIGDEPAQLWVAKNNSRARSFYERNGFRADGVEVTDPQLDALVEIRMVR
jgi:ribosomal protein S18 acetylase RimI-like enzyme